MADHTINYRDVFYSDPKGLIIFGKDYKVKAYNKIADYYIKTYFMKQLALNQYIFEYSTENYVEKMKESLAKAMGGEILEYEENILNAKNTSDWFECSFNPIISNNSEITGVSFAIKFIKKRKLMEENLTQRLAFEKLVSKISTRFISFTDMNHAINISLQEMGKFSGASRSYIFTLLDNKRMMDNTHEWCAQGITSEMHNLKGLPSAMFTWWMEKLEKGESILINNVSNMEEEAKFEKRILKAQGIVAVAVLPIFVKKSLYGFMGFDYMHGTKGWDHEDLSLLQVISEIFSNAFERLLVEQALVSSEKKFRELFNNANDIICVHTLSKIDQKMCFIEVNELACKKTGYSREEYLNMTPADLCTSEFAHCLPKLQENIIQQNHITYEMEYVAKDGTKVPVEMNSHLFWLNGQQVVMTIGRDITERMRMQNEFKEKNIELKDTIIRLKETQSRLIQQEQLAGIGQLAAGVAHEINNPLAFIISNCSTLQKYLTIILDDFQKNRDFISGLLSLPLPLDVNKQLITILKQYDDVSVMEDLEEILMDIQEGLQRVNNIVKGLSIFSRVDPREELKPLDLHGGIRNTLLVAINEYKYCTQIESHLNPIPLIKGNAGQVNQVLLNILLNAAYSIKAKTTFENIRGVIKVTTYYDQSFVYCEIEDNGQGVSKENINQIFNPFFTTKPVGEGTGLGLSIVYDIMVNKHKGEIDVQSTFGKGTKFILKFPLSLGNAK